MPDKEEREAVHRSKLSFARGVLWSALLSLVVWIPLIWWLIVK